MKKTTRNFLIMLAVLVVLGGAAAALLFLPQGQEESGSSSQASSSPVTVVVDWESENVASISVENREGGFRIVPTGENGDFTLDGYEKYDLNTTLINTSAGSLMRLVSSKDLGERENLEDFGLAGESAVNVTAQFRDGSEETLVLGNAGGESTGRYVLKDGRVYIASSASEQLYGSLYDFFNTEVYTVKDRVEDVVNSQGETTQQTADDRLNSMALSGTQFPEPIEVRYDSGKVSGYLITSPITAEAGSTKFNDLITSLKSLSASSVEAAGLTQEVLERYGLSEPCARIEFDLNGEKHTLAVSETNGEGSRYLMADDRDVVYAVPEDSVSSWADAKLLDLRMSYVWLPNIAQVDKLTLTVEGDMVYAYDVTRTKNEEKSTEDDPVYDTTVKNAGGQDVDYENYQDFYQKLIGISVLSTDKTEFSGVPALRAEFAYSNGETPDVIEYYAVGSDRYAAVLNGAFNGLVRKGDPDKLISLLPQLDKNQPVE